jgi:hypothetical protein
MSGAMRAPHLLADTRRQFDFVADVNALEVLYLGTYALGWN